MKYQSKLLNEEIWIGENPPEDMIGYTQEELNKLKDVKQYRDLLKKVHLTKKILGGKVINVS